LEKALHRGFTIGRSFRLDHITEEGQEVVGLGVEGEGVQGPEGEGGVSNPGVAIVPISVTTGMFR
jgi:hypothetical protein